MTTQTPNFFLYEEKIYTIQMRSTMEYVFTPQRNLGIKSFSASSAGHRGFIAIFSHMDNHLALDSLCLQVDNPQQINGSTPSKERDEIFKSEFTLDFISENMNYFYRNIGLKIDYSGSIIL